MPKWQGDRETLAIETFFGLVKSKINSANPNISTIYQLFEIIVVL